ncbi:O-unit flippase-like protein [Lacticaseibacillus daqingensis]|uniref:O-unit flippase-like protein n=1 Tax=Lacticaseibacillus daqingensis TaxID=2486014 RepID=UPI000F7B104A|nr:O-unit flippase-like protein [Lacticaseibacillus daqingensis]
MKIKASRADVIWSYIGTVFSLSSSFLLLPFVMLKLTGAELGLWYIFLAVNGLVNLFDFGFDPTFARNIAYAWGGADGITKTGAKSSSGPDATPNYHLLATLVATSRRLYRHLSSLALVLVSTVGTMYIVSISGEIKGHEYLIAWAIFCVGLFLNLYLGYYSALLRGIGAVEGINQSTMLAKVCQLVVSIILLYLNLGLIAVAVGFIVNGTMFRVFCSRYFQKFKNTGALVSEEMPSVTKDEVHETYKAVSYNAFRDGGVAISNYLSTQASSLVASTFLPLSATGEYSILLQFSNAVVNVAATIIYAYHPTLQSAYQRHDIDTEKEYIGRGLSAYYLLFVLGTLGVTACVFPLLHWIKPTMTFDVLLYLGVSLYTFLWQHQSTAASYISNTNRVPYMVPFMIASVSGIVLSLIIVKYTAIGVWALVVGPGIVQLMFNNWYWLHTVVKRLGTTWRAVILSGLGSWRRSLLRR